MNQRYLLLTSLLVAGTAVAQQAHHTLQKMQFAENVAEEEIPATGGERAGGDIVFNENFANGFAGNSGFGAWTVSGPDGAIWMRRTTGPVGAYTQANQIIAQPAPANGFMAFLSDSANCNCSSGGAANWPATPTEWDGALESPQLDLSATPFVMLQWKQRLRWCCQATSPHAVEVSTDGGLTWPVTMEAASGIATNEDPGTQTRQLIMSAAIATNPSMVKFRFHHNATAAAYFWQIDDVQLVELFSDDMKLDYSYLSHTGTGEEYGRIPSAQLQPTMLIGGSVINNGAQAQTNVTVTVDVVGTVPFTATINGGIVDPGVTAAVEQDYPLPALTAGLYESTATVSADNTDQVPDNNTYLRNFEVNETVYSVDGIGNHPAGLQQLGTIGTQSFTDAEDGLVLMNYYEAFAPLTVYGLHVELGTTVAGGYMIATLRDTAGVFAIPANMAPVIAESDPKDVMSWNVTSADIDVCFNAPVVLAPNAYFAGVTLFSNAGQADIRVVDDLTVPQPGWTSAIYIPNDDSYTNGNGFAIRLILSQAVCDAAGVQQEEGLDGVSLYPNPTNGRLTVRMDAPGSYTIEVMDLLGQTVYQTRSNGNATLDLAGQAKGVYMVRVSSADASTVQRITLN